MTLGQAFDPRNNALNAIRLALAAQVMLFHSFIISGHPLPQVLRQLIFSVGVDGFFAISGFLITSSWLSRPRLRDYLVARALRILPGFYVCLIVTAFIIAPLGVAIQGGSATKLLMSAAPFEYVVDNSALAYIHFDVGGTPSGIPAAGAWNGSLWSLIWEALCYLAVAVIGVVGLANRRWVSPAILTLSVLAATLLPPLSLSEEWTIPQLLVRSVIMFAAGAFLYQFKEIIPARWLFVGLSVVILFAAGLLPDYRVVAAIPLAYIVIVSGALTRKPRLNLRTDLSYGMYIYAFPVQQLLAMCGLAGLSPYFFFVVSAVATLPLAMLSWLLVEKRAMSLKSHLLRKRSTQALAQPGAHREDTRSHRPANPPTPEVRGAA